MSVRILSAQTFLQSVPCSGKRLASESSLARYLDWRTLLERLHIKESGIYLAGGFIRDVIKGKLTLPNPEATDIDLFFRSQEIFDRWQNSIAKSEKFLFYRSKSNLVEYLVLINDKYYKLQAMHKKFYSTADALVDEFDFDICQFAVYIKSRVDVSDCIMFAVGENSVRSVITNKIAVNKITYPADSIRRLTKYVLKGYIPCNGTCRDLALAISKFKENDPEIAKGKLYPVD